MEVNYTVIDPTGNVTLLVTTPVDRALHAQVAKRLMQREKSAEQVAFLEQTDGQQPRLQMMGGEFCGNAAMALGAWLSSREGDVEGESRAFSLEVSGAPQAVSCTVTPVRTCYLGTVDMPLPEKIAQMPLPDGEQSVPVVFMPGICHIILPQRHMAHADAEELLRQWSARLMSSPAVGLLLWDEEKSALTPLVYVRQTNSTMWENCCASGAAALAAALTCQRQADQCLSLKQPGGTVVAVTRYDGSLQALTVTGTVRLVRDTRANVIF